MESADAIDDSDDEVDYTKMDQGNKKGPVGRWDFDTQEEYSSYMSTKEALPKYAFHSLFHITAGEVKQEINCCHPWAGRRSRGDRRDKSPPRIWSGGMLMQIVPPDFVI